MTVSEERTAAIAGQFQQCLREGRAVDDPLDELLAVSGGRAAGFWRVVRDELELVGFRAAADMPPDVSRAFCTATARIPLDDRSLGIVKAVVDRTPAPASVEGNDGEMRGSAAWLQQFNALRSLAVPILRGAQVAGVLAVSTRREVAPGSNTHAVLTGVSDRLGSALSEL